MLPSGDAGNLRPNFINTGTCHDVKGLVVGVAEIEIGNSFRRVNYSKLFTPQA